MGILSDAASLLKSKISDLFPETPTQLQFPTEMLARVKSGQSSPIQNEQLEPMKPQTPQNPIGKITSYNFKGDKYSDSNSRNWIGSWGKLSEVGMAVSPDVEKQFREAGIKPKDKVMVVLSDGTELERIWDNRTMQDKQAIRKFGKPLTGRFDLHHPTGTSPHEKDGVAVVGFKRISEDS